MSKDKKIKVAVYMSVEEHARMVFTATARGMSVSGFLRVLALEAATAWEAGK